jgi:hypothetical protein
VIVHAGQGDADRDNLVFDGWGADRP